jgi:hypothetical protein
MVLVLFEPKRYPLLSLPFGPKKVSIFMALHLSMALKMDLPTHTSTAAAKLKCIKLQMCLFFLYGAGTFLGSKGTRFVCCHFRAQKSLDFHGPPFPMALAMDLQTSKPLPPAPYNIRYILTRRYISQEDIDL